MTTNNNLTPKFQQVGAPLFSEKRSTISSTTGTTLVVQRVCVYDWPGKCPAINKNANATFKVNSKVE